MAANLRVAMFYNCRSWSVQLSFKSLNQSCLQKNPNRLENLKLKLKIIV